MKKPNCFRVFVSLALLAVARTPAAADEFYTGKTIRFVVGFSAGGGYDTYTRAIARHIGKHIPGNPQTVVENMVAFLLQIIFLPRRSRMVSTSGCGMPG